MIELSNNTLTANELRNDRDTINADTTLIEGTTTPDEGPVAERSSQNMTRRKLKIFVSIAVAVGVIILVILIPILGLRKNA
ncbi:unnamed protein product [Adineta steineri]|uniref:Uncharacterized protein n=1 Tax=Adineta steineri TaxID=433720 RepID=A0A816DQV3_9BILA|nr:unnamed protein product [Adineta steineri]CAF1642053.1 unnamed protein product [Adineta steineri]